MSSWWMLDIRSNKQFIPTIKKKFFTLLKLIVKGNIVTIILIVKSYIFNIFLKTCFLDLLFLPYYILTHFNFVKKKLPINLQETKTRFALDIDNIFFREQLLKSKLYLEYGSGTSTLLADRNNINYYSIESDKIFYRNLKKHLKNKNYFLKSFGIVAERSRPIFNTYNKSFISKNAQKYAEDILLYFNEKNLVPDLILIDGRFRILCALFVYKFLKERNYSSTTVIIDDYKSRLYLHIIENLFHVKKVGSFGVCSQLKEFKNLDELIKVYLEDYR